MTPPLGGNDRGRDHQVQLAGGDLERDQRKPEQIAEAAGIAAGDDPEGDEVERDHDHMDARGSQPRHGTERDRPRRSVEEAREVDDATVPERVSGWSVEVDHVATRERPLAGREALDEQDDREGVAAGSSAAVRSLRPRDASAGSAAFIPDRPMPFPAGAAPGRRRPGSRASQRSPRGRRRLRSGRAPRSPASAEPRPAGSA